MPVAQYKLISGRWCKH